MLRLYRLHPAYEVRDQNCLIADLVDRIVDMYPTIEVIDSVADRLHFTVDGYDCHIDECEMLVEFEDRIVGLTFLDGASKLLGLLQHRNNPNDLLAYAQPDNFCDQYNFKTVKCNYLLRWPTIDLHIYYNIRKNLDSFVDKLYFRGNYDTLPRKSIHTLLEPIHKGIFEGAWGLNPEPYFEEVAHHKIGLSIPGAGEMCYRDVEYMAIGIPMLRLEYESNFNPPLIPNHHYISIDRPEGLSYKQEREGSPELAKMYIERFMEVKDDIEFLQFVSNNAREYYDTYLDKKVRIPHTLNLMEIPHG